MFPVRVRVAGVGSAGILATAKTGSALRTATLRVASRSPLSGAPERRNATAAQRVSRPGRTTGYEVRLGSGRPPHACVKLDLRSVAEGGMQIGRISYTASPSDGAPGGLRHCGAAGVGCRLQRAGIGVRRDLV